MRVRNFRPFHFISFIGFAGWHFYLYVRNPDVADLAYRHFLFAMSETNENSIPGISCFYILDRYIFQRTTIYRLQCNGRPVRIVYFYILHPYMFKSAMRSGSKLQGAGAGPHYTIADLYILTKGIGIS